jgi:hypothetical protein
MALKSCLDMGAFAMRAEENRLVASGRGSWKGKQYPGRKAMSRLSMRMERQCQWPITELADFSAGAGPARDKSRDEIMRTATTRASGMRRC